LKGVKYTAYYMSVLAGLQSTCYTKHSCVREK